MEFKFQFILAFLFLVLVTGSHGGEPSEDYWKSVLPNTPLPPHILVAKTLQDVLQTPTSGWLDSIRERYEGYSKYNVKNKGTEEVQTTKTDHRTAVIFFLEKDLHPTTNLTLQFQESTSGAKFLPRRVADSIPFSSNELPTILNMFSVDPTSDTAGVIKDTIQDCHDAGIKGEVILCATSLESMVDFSTSKLGKDVEAIWTKPLKDNHINEVKEYSIVGAKRMPSGKGLVACHKMYYPYGVFYCHKISNSVAYKVSLEAADGSKVEAVASCHQDTSGWNPNHLAFEMLKVKPGGLPICHFLRLGHIAWVENKY